MDRKKSKRLLAKLAIFYWLLAILVYAIGQEQFHYQAVKSKAPDPGAARPRGLA